MEEKIKLISAFNILNNICFGKANRTEVNNLIELTHNYATTYLKYRYKNLGKVLLAEDVTINELAIDAIAQLFERNDGGDFTQIIRAFNEWTPKIENEEQALFFINRLAAKSIEKYVSDLLRKSDPFFSKILDSVNYIIEKNNYSKKQILGTTYIAENEGNDGRWNIGIKNLPDRNFIDELPIRLFNSAQNVVAAIFEYLKTNSDKYPAIPLNALVLKIKQVNATKFIINDSVSDNSLEIDSIVEKALTTTFFKLQESYVDKNKIDPFEAIAIKESLKLIVFDMRDGGINPGLHKYLMQNIANLSFEDYKTKYQNVFEYLFKVLKKEIVDQLK